ncbi:MAG: ABC transporter ATP-binding protein [Proteobacteria bacterium]|nr:ABC transporter ATP-binding protein [Pseudomonadota bacterium]
MSDVVVENLARHWGPTKALDGVSFKVEAGSFAVLLGPSGCGKSTLLRLIAGLETPTGGSIRIAGKDVTGLPPAKRGIAMVFQSYALFPHLSVAQNICFGLEVRHVDAAERKRRLERAAELLGLTKLLDRKPSQLSGGQQQRVALGRAIVAQAPVCLMDEPLSNLDAQLRHEMRLEIRELQRRLSMTMIYVTHDQVEAMTMADQVVLLRDGRIEQDAAPDELYANPATIFAARFIGTPPMNVVDLDDAGHIAETQGGAGALGVRPEDIVVVPHETPGAIQARVESIEYLGADTLIAARKGAGRLVARVPGKAKIEAGAAIGLAWTQEAQHIFDNRTGRRVADPPA